MDSYFDKRKGIEEKVFAIISSHQLGEYLKGSWQNNEFHLCNKEGNVSYSDLDLQIPDIKYDKKNVASGIFGKVIFKCI